jgi:putative membrane protein
MNRHKLRTTILASTLLPLPLILCAHTIAQQTNRRDANDVKPAQAGSPAAHPTSPTNSQPASTTRRSTSERADENRRVVNPAERTDSESNLDRHLASCLITKNKGEAELGRYASEHANSRDVKNYADQMVKDHSRFVEQLERIVGSQQPTDQKSQIAREIDEECLATLKKELSDKSDKDFDKCYIGSQIAAHLEMAATLKVISEHASGKLRGVVQDARSTVDEHLADARKIMDQLDQSRDHAQAAKNRDDRTR